MFPHWAIDISFTFSKQQDQDFVHSGLPHWPALRSLILHQKQKHSYLTNGITFTFSWCSYVLMFSIHLQPTLYQLVLHTVLQWDPCHFFRGTTLPHLSTRTGTGFTLPIRPPPTLHYRFLASRTHAPEQPSTSPVTLWDSQNGMKSLAITSFYFLPLTDRHIIEQTAHNSINWAPVQRLSREAAWT